MMSLESGFASNAIICNKKKSVDLDALNLLASGEAGELCQCSYKYENDHHYFIYNTDSLTPLVQLQAELAFENVIEILSSAAQMIQMLLENSLLLDNIKNAKQYIFKSDAGYRFIYIPIVQKPHLSVRDYINKLVAVIHYKDARLNQFLKELRKLKDNEQVLAHLTDFISSYNLHNNCSDEGETSLLSDECATSLLSLEGNKSENHLVLLSDEGETTVLSQAGNMGEDCAADIISESAKLTEFFHDESDEYETTVLTSIPAFQSLPTNQEIKSEYCLHLIRNLNGEKIPIDVTPFTIGKDSANMDYVLNNDSVSRHHATVIYENGDYFILDNHSTNGTIIEGIKLQSGEKGEIENGYIISLGNESFQAHIERR